MKPQPMSSLGGYDPSRNSFPSSSQTSNTGNASGDTQSPSWRVPALQPPPHSVPSNATETRHKIVVPPAPEPMHTINPLNRSIRFPKHSYPSPSSQSSHDYTSSTGPYPEDHSRPLSNEQSPPPKLTLRTPQVFRHPRPRTATSSFSTSSSPHPTPAAGSAYAVASPSLPGPAAGEAAIIHSPIVPSPRPLHQSPPPYNSYPLPPLPRKGGPMTNVDPREHTAQYAQPGHPHFHSPSGQHPGSSTAGWTQTSSPRAQDRQYDQPANVPYDDRRNTPIPGISRVDRRADGERSREAYSDNQPYPGHGWHPPSASSTHSNLSAWATEPYSSSRW
jgi:hypothetical protein